MSNVNYYGVDSRPPQRPACGTALSSIVVPDCDCKQMTEMECDSVPLIGYSPKNPHPSKKKAEEMDSQNIDTTGEHPIHIPFVTIQYKSHL
jgi:hypothetical protein